MSKSMSKSRRKAIVHLESIIGSECYNQSIRNHGPGGVRESDGRSFRYPLMIHLGEGSKQKVRSDLIPDSVSDEALRSGHYAFGANQLDVISAIDRMLKYLEKNHGLSLKDDD
jgi:hypothetical protein